jgi:Tfp pilus assembly protein PilN
MRAVNLIPRDERRGGGGAGGRSGGAVYIVLGALAALVVMVAAVAMSGRAVDDKKADLARVEQAATASEAKAASLKNYADFRALRTGRTETVRSIANSRFDWSFVLHELARTIPSNVWLTGVTGTVTPAVPLQVKPVTAGLRSALGTPALELLGCTTDQESVSRMLSALRQVDGVRRVSLQSALKSDAATAVGEQTIGADCRYGSKRFPKFTMVVFFDAKPAPAAATQAPQTTSTSATP